MSKLQQVDPAAERRQAETRSNPAAAKDVKTFGFFKQGNEAVTFVSGGTYYFRLLAQPMGAKKSWTITVPYFYMDPLKTPGFKGYVPLSPEQSDLLDQIRAALYKHPEYGLRMKRKTNVNGTDLSPKYRQVFMGFIYTDPNPQVKPIVLPASNPQLKEGRIQAGTAIVQFIYELDFKGQPKYGPLTDEKTGRLIKVEVVGESDRREYKVSVDQEAPTNEPKFMALIDQVQAFENILNYPTTESFVEILKARLPLDMHPFVNKLIAAAYPNISLDTTLPNVAAPVATAPVVAPVAPVAAPVAPVAPAPIVAPSNSEPIFKRYGFNNMEEFRAALMKDPSFLTKV